MSDTPVDEPSSIQPAVLALEREAISFYRSIHPSAPLWQDLAHETRTMWVAHAEKLREKKS